jgi:hypothetical protein
MPFCVTVFFFLKNSLLTTDVPDQPKEPFVALVHSVLSDTVSPSMLLYHYRLRQVHAW